MRTRVTSGRTSPRRGVHVVGLDLSPEMCAIASRTTPLPACAADMTALPLRAGALSGLVCMYAVIHLDTAQRAAAYREFARVLADGGHALIAFHTSDAEHRTGETQAGQRLVGPRRRPHLPLPRRRRGSERARHGRPGARRPSRPRARTPGPSTRASAPTWSSGVPSAFATQVVERPRRHRTAEELLDLHRGVRRAGGRRVADQVVAAVRVHGIELRSRLTDLPVAAFPLAARQLLRSSTSRRRRRHRCPRGPPGSRSAARAR